MVWMWFSSTMFRNFDARGSPTRTFVGAGEWAACADVGVRLRRKSKDQYALCFDMQKGRHYGTFQQELQFMANFTRIEEVLDNNNPKSL